MHTCKHTHPRAHTAKAKPTATATRPRTTAALTPRAHTSRCGGVLPCETQYGNSIVGKAAAFVKTGVPTDLRLLHEDSGDMSDVYPGYEIVAARHGNSAQLHSAASHRYNRRPSQSVADCNDMDCKRGRAIKREGVRVAQGRGYRGGARGACSRLVS